MHRSVFLWVDDVVDEHQLRGLRVLDVGSLNVNGSCREHFHGPYIGVDARAGRDVDRVCDAHQLGDAFPAASFDVVLSTEMLEHDSAPWLSVAQMRHVARPGGWLLLTCRGFDERGSFPLHDYPRDLWRFSCDGVRELLARAGWRPVDVSPDPDAPGVFALARKP